jgi:hypothetical protein
VRHSRYRRSPARDRDLKRAYETLLGDTAVDDELLHQSIAFIVALLAEDGACESLCDSLRRKRRECENLIGAMDRYAALSSRYGNEYVQHMRITPPAADRDELIRSNQIAGMLLGKLYGEDVNAGG